mmetsp:Transcript_15612/g.32533  ORF Transcript_15612/g.32533 Transcript_15612/m.32533 type:complete len:320 (+) Transcript_15612:247-1206(+)
MQVVPGNVSATVQCSEESSGSNQHGHAEVPRACRRLHSNPSRGRGCCCQLWLLCPHRSRRLSDHRVDGAVLDAALSILWHPALQADVARFTPSRTPGILDLPVIGAIFCAITHKQHAVVEFAAALLCQNATLVELEGHLVGLDGHRHRLLRHGLQEGPLILNRHILEALHAALGDANRAVGLLALQVLCLVRVAGLRAHWVLLQVLKREVHAATFAAHVTVLRAVHELLLAQGQELTCCDLPSALQGTSCGEGPARTALRLILWRRHRALCRPVHRRRRCLAAELVRAQVRHVPEKPCGHWTVHPQVVLAKLFRRLVRK